MKTFGPPGCGFPAEEPGIPSKTLQWRDATSNAKAAGLDRSFRHPKRDEWLGPDGPLQDRTEGERQWVAGNFGPAMSTILPTPRRERSYRAFDFLNRT
jgi:hypothetical protein